MTATSYYCFPVPKGHIKSPLVVLVSVNPLSASKVSRGILRPSHYPLWPYILDLLCPAPLESSGPGLLPLLNLHPGGSVPPQVPALLGAEPLVASGAQAPLLPTVFLCTLSSYKFLWFQSWGDRPSTMQKMQPSHCGHLLLPPTPPRLFIMEITSLFMLDGSISPSFLGSLPK